MMNGMWANILWCLIGLVVGAIVGFLLASQKQINQMMKAMNKVQQFIALFFKYKV